MLMAGMSYPLSVLRQKNLNTAFSSWKCIKCFPFTERHGRLPSVWICVDENSSRVFIRFNTAAFIKFFVIRVRRLFEGDVYLKSSLFLLKLNIWISKNINIVYFHSISMSLSSSRKYIFLGLRKLDYITAFAFIYGFFSSTLKRKTGVFKFLRFGESFRKAPFSWRCVEGRPKSRNLPAFSDFPGVVKRG